MTRQHPGKSHFATLGGESDRHSCTERVFSVLSLLMLSSRTSIFYSYLQLNMVLQLETKPITFYSYHLQHLHHGNCSKFHYRVCPVTILHQARLF